MRLLPDYPFLIGYGPNDDRLHDFYLPALQGSQRYDRATGFFSSYSLAKAGAGIARLIANSGKMRILCGAELTEEDVEAVRQGADLAERVGRAMRRGLPEGVEDPFLKGRLEGLAWMVAEGLLEIRVVLPRGSDGLPLAAADAQEYYHPKEGVFRDSAGNRLAFSGSSNESRRGWELNYETFQVFSTWDRTFDDQVVPAMPGFVRQIESRFEELWERGDNPSWIALELPVAARERLLQYRPPAPPGRDPLEKKEASKPPEPEGDPQRDRLVFQFLREAPYLPNADRLGVETAAVTPWPHQDRVIDTVVGRFPQGFLLCDEVGLGKTIEAGLAIRQLVISGRVKRALFLVPASVLRQWQEELWEKCALNVPRYKGGRLLDIHDRELPYSGASPWNAVPLLLATSQLAKRRDRQDEVIEAGPWDLVLVDEAHHARRKGFREQRFRPNRLLELLLGSGGRPGLRDRARCLHLLTATPMQIHSLEVWDLLKVLGLGGRWGAVEENFIRFFEEMRLPFDDRDWDFLLDMHVDHLKTGGEIDPGFATAARERVGPVDWDIVRNLPSTHKRRARILQLGPTARAVLEEMVRRHTPLRTLMFRNTRELLRRYREKGILKERIPNRDPVNRWVSMRVDERELYDRIEEYIGDFYRKYENERKGLGFVMTVYRRRLTSSFYAIRKSLERRKEFLEGTSSLRAGLTEEDLEEEDLDFDFWETLQDVNREQFLAELEYVEDFLYELSTLGGDSKLERLKEEIRQLFRERDTILVFTQYTDTMDYLREELRGVYAEGVACYSGRGGEVWDGVGWVPRSKEELKEEFRRGDKIKILLCTESASEGLNLQTCGVLINFDMPWNPMRVEQRIGRIDRIGQKYDEVWIRNYFYEETVEATIYQRLSDRIDWFEAVVGNLQPILHRVSQVIQTVAMLPSREKQNRLDEEIEEIRKELDEIEVRSLDLDAYLDADIKEGRQRELPVSLPEIEQILTTCEALRGRFRQDPSSSGIYELRWKDLAHSVTFQPDVFDRHPYTTQLLTYGNPLFHELLNTIPDPALREKERGVAVFRVREEAPISLFLGAENGRVEDLDTIGEYTAYLNEDSRSWSVRETEQASKRFQEARAHLVEELREPEENRREAERLALLEEARLVLARTALLHCALMDQRSLFDETAPPAFGPEAVKQLRERGVPYRGLLAILEREEIEAKATDPYYMDQHGRSEVALRGRIEHFRRNGVEILRAYRKLTEDRSISSTPRVVSPQWISAARQDAGSTSEDLAIG